MTETTTTSNGVNTVFAAVLFWGFIATKTWGTALAAWSWWWMLLPIVPWCGYLVQRLHL
jgi:hypothetical protein